jgi:hypothetical protein
MFAEETGAGGLGSANLCIFYAEELPFLYWIITGSDGSLNDAKIVPNTKTAVDALKSAIIVYLNYSLL